ncbi:MAG: Hsp20/alpha crystallin family protein [Candidatus Omnitrophica bacterium]|nr:Hsp20/alpha crystallin family protein [Candidatus Omnitrophota bacterium]
MKNIVFMVAAACFLASVFGDGYAQTQMSAKEEKELEELSGKLVRMKRAVDKFANELVSSFDERGREYVAPVGRLVRVDVIENEKDFTVKADLPGMDKDKIVVTLENNRILKISGSRESSVTEKGPNIVRQERMEGRFERVVELPAECKNEGISASYKNGVLEIIIPKKEAAKPQAIKVKVE